MWAMQRFHSRDSGIVSGFGDLVVGGLCVMVLAALGEAMWSGLVVGFGGVRD
jgi:hypothetical protein